MSHLVLSRACALRLALECTSGRRWTVLQAAFALARRSQGDVRKRCAMSICGVITTKDVLKHSATIVREFGPAAYFRCCLAILRGERTTFLKLVFARIPEASNS